MRRSTQSGWLRLFRFPKCAGNTILTFAIALMIVPCSHAGAPGPEPEFEPNELNTIEVPVAPIHETAGETNPIAGRSPTPLGPPAKTIQRSVPAIQAAPAPPAIILDPSARMIKGSDASEYWSLYIELESGHRITQQFLLSNSGPGDHNAVALGHLLEPGRAPYRYVNGRRRSRWTLSKDRLFLDISASHLDLHRPTGELRITKDDIEIRLFFDFAESDLSRRVPEETLPKNYHVEVLAIAAKTSGTIQAPWMNEPLETSGRAWLVHTWTPRSEAEIIDRRMEVFGFENGTSFYGLQLRSGEKYRRAWLLSKSDSGVVVESSINIPANWTEEGATESLAKTRSYPVPGRYMFSGGSFSGQITLGREWLRFDPLAVLPQPFRWFVRRKTKPEQVWADAKIGVRLSPALETPSLPDASEAESDSNSKREIEEKTAERSVTGVATITFLNPSGRR